MTIKIEQRPSLAAAMQRLRDEPAVPVVIAAIATGASEYTIREAIRRGDVQVLRLGRNIKVLSAPLRRQLGLEE